VLDDYQGVCDDYADWSVLGHRVDRVVFRDTAHDPAALAARLAPFDIIATMRERTAFPRTLLERLPNLKLLTTTGMRNRAFDLAFARARGIVVCGTASTYDSTTELTFALILALARNLVAETRSVQQGGWQVGVGIGLRGRTLGLLGLGKIGAEVAAIARLVGMRVIAWSPNLTAERCASQGVVLVDRATLFADADFVSVHMVLSPRTEGMVGRDDLARMRPTAFFINTSRGPLVDQDALVEALAGGAIAGAALDVFDQEPLAPDAPIRTCPRVLLTPHIGYVTEEHYRIFYPQTVENILAFLDGTPIRPLLEAS
jgi:phosphoglycerate dehydrogenase-like enzyme